MSFIVEKLLAKVGFETPIRSKQRPFNPRYYRRFSLENTKDYALLMIGAHNGLKTKYFVKRPLSERLINKKLNNTNLNIMRNWKICLNEYLENDFKKFLNADN